MSWTNQLVVNKSVFRRHRSASAKVKPPPKTISRASSRRSRGDSSQQAERGQSSCSNSDNEDARASDIDTLGVDITDDKAWDTDLESDEPVTTYDHSGRTTYLQACKKMGVIPVSYFLRHMHDKQLDMRHHGLGSSGMRAVATAMVTNTSILTLDLSDNYLGSEGGLAMCDMLRENCFVTDLTISDNHLHTCAQELCRTLGMNDSLRRVTLSGNGFNDSSAVFFADYIMSPIRLEYLNLSHNNLSEAAGVLLGPAISDNSSLKELDLSWNQIRRRGAAAVAAGVKTNVYMKRINLSWNGFGLEGAIALGDALKGNSVLEELDITNNRIMTEGAVLIGKGLSVNETLKVLKIGLNPMQSAGCWGICAAILRNPNCILEELDFQAVLVNKDFEEIFKQVQEQLPELKMRHGGMEPPLKPKARVHPMVKVMAYITSHNIRIVDFFNKFDTDGNMSVTHDEFKQGLKELGIPLLEEEMDLLMTELDSDGDGAIQYSELALGTTEFKDREKRSNALPTLRPMTS